MALNMESSAEKIGVDISPPIGGNVASYNSIINKTLLLFLMVLAGSFTSWYLTLILGKSVLLLAGIVGIASIFGVFALTKQSNNGTGRPWMYLLFSFAEGFCTGPISMILEAKYPGIALQAVLSTLGVAIVVMLLYRFKVVRASKKFAKIVLFGLLGLLAFRLIALLIYFITGVFLETGGIGIAVSIVAVFLASMCLVADFDYIDIAVEEGASENSEWMLATSVIITLVWMYIEILRLLSKSRN